MNISGLGVGASPSLGVYDLSIAFDSAVLAYSGITWGTGLDVLGFGSIQSLTAGLADVNLFELSLDSAGDLNTLQADAFVLFTLTFVTSSAGTSPIDIQVNALGDENGDAIAHSVLPGNIEISDGTAIPEPGSAMLCVAGLLFVAGMSRREEVKAELCGWLNL